MCTHERNLRAEIMEVSSLLHCRACRRPMSHQGFKMFDLRRTGRITLDDLKAIAKEV